MRWLRNSRFCRCSGEDLITHEKSNLERIVATLEMKEMTQGTLIRKLCTYTTAYPTRQAGTQHLYAKIFARSAAGTQHPAFPELD